MHKDLTSFFDKYETAEWSPKMTMDERSRFHPFFIQSLDKIDLAQRTEFFNWIRTQSTMTSVRMDIDIPHQEMYEEGLRLYDWAVKHRGETHQGWQSICIHGLDYNKTGDACAAYGYEDRRTAPYKWTIASELAPVASAWFKDTFPMGVYQRVRFMYLEPDGYILPHNDYHEPGLGAFNIALNNPDGCSMVTERGTIPWAAGDVRIFDTHNEHAVWNRSDQLRIHMIAHSHDWSIKHEALIDSIIRGYLTGIGV